MSFLTPVFLFGLLAAAIPLAIHLIRRDKPPKVVFSTLRFFQQTSRKQFLFQRLQQWLLLLLRTLVVLLVVVAFARPFFSQSLSGWADLAPRSAVVLLDTSMSMGYGDYLQRAKQSANEILDELGPGDEATLVLFTDKANQVYGPTTDHSSLRAAIAELERPSFETTRYFPAIRLADELLADSHFEDKLVYLVSDFQESGMTDFDSDWKLHPGINLVTKNIADERTRNLAITGVKSPSSLRAGQMEDELFIRLRSLGSMRQESAELTVSINDEQQVTKQVNLRDQSETVVRVPIALQGEGSHVGRVQVADANFALDNDFFFTVDVLPKIPVLVINGEASRQWFEDEAHWFALAVSSNEQSPFSTRTMAPTELSAELLEEFQVVVLLNAGDLNDRQSEALQDFVEAGGSLLIAPGDRVQAGSFNRQLAAVSPANLLSRGNLAASDYLLIADMQTRHPVLRPLDRSWGVRFTDYWQLKPADSAEVLMSFDNGEPALVERRVGQGRSLMFASTLDTEWNNLPLQSMYLPFIHEALKYLANTPEKKAFYLVGESVSVDSFPSADNLIGPDGRAMSVQEGETRVSLREPGIYRRESEGAATLFYAVNRAAEESDFSAMSPAVLVDQVLNPETTPNQSAEVRTQLIKAELERPQRLWWWILLAVLLLLLAESVMANRTYR